MIAQEMMIIIKDDDHFCLSRLLMIPLRRHKTSYPPLMVMIMLIMTLNDHNDTGDKQTNVHRDNEIKVRHSRSKTPSPIMRSKAGHFRADSQPPAR